MHNSMLVVWFEVYNVALRVGTCILGILHAYLLQLIGLNKLMKRGSLIIINEIFDFENLMFLH